MLQRMLRADRGEPFDLSRLIGEAWPLLFIGVAYVILGLAGLELASLNPSVTLVWPPTGLAIAVVLLCGQRVVPVIFAAAFVVNQLILPSASTSVIIASGNTLEAVLAGFLIGYWAGGVRAFASPTNVLKFFMILISFNLFNSGEQTAPICKTLRTIYFCFSSLVFFSCRLHK